MPADRVFDAVACCGAIVILAEPVTIPLLRRLRAFDVPGLRSSHSVPTLRGGGIPIAVGLLVAVALIRGGASATFGFAVGFFGLLGFIDDLRGLPAARRLALQGAGSAGVAVLLIRPMQLAAVAAVTLTFAATVWITGFVNAFNFMDGVNGISATHALIAGVAYACYGEWEQQQFLMAAGLAVAVAALMFLPWNAGRARVFLGDVGSYTLGAALAMLAALAVLRGLPVEAVVGPLALYLADTAWTLQRRIRAGERWLQPHRTHVYQRWCDAGWSHQEVTLLTGAITILLTGLGTVSLSGDLQLRAAADVAGLAILGVYLSSPAVFRRLGLYEDAEPQRYGDGPRPSVRDGIPDHEEGPADVRILLVTHYFPPETGAPQARLSALAQIWAADGDTVTVLTGLPNHPTGVVAPEYRGAIRRREGRDGYRVLRTWLYATPNEGMARKTLGHLSFMVTSVLFGAVPSGRADVVVVSSPTFFSVGAAWALARIKRARLVVEIRDLWPAIFTELGVLTNRRIIGLLERLERAAYAAADEVVVVSEGFRDNLISRGVPPHKVHTIRNGVLLDQFGPAAGPALAVRGRLGAAPGDCLVLYAGTHGISHALPAIARAAARLAGQPVHFAFVGEGADKARLARTVAELGLRNVTLLPGVAHQDVPDLLAAADICLVPLRDVPLFATFIPSKMFEYLAAGKAVVGSVSGEAAQILREAGAVVVPPEDDAALADAIRDLAADPEGRLAMGRAGRCHVEQHYNRVELAREYRKILHTPGGRP